MANHNALAVVLKGIRICSTAPSAGQRMYTKEFQ